MDGEDEIPEITAEGPPKRRRLGLGCLVLAAVLLLALLAVWLLRRDLADRVVASQLKDLDVPATYQVEEVGLNRQVLRNVVVGDPKRPDFTAERIEVAITPRFGVPTVDKVTLVHPRLYGSYRQGKLSFGALDRLLFTESKEPFRLPNMAVSLIDGRGRLDSDYGAVGFKAQGSGHLRDGFAGTLAAIAQQAGLEGCSATGASLYGKLSIKDEQPRFAGPLRNARLECPGQGLAMNAAGAELDLRFAKALDAVEGTAQLASGETRYGSSRLAALAGELDLAWKGGELAVDYDLSGERLSLAAGSLATLTANGTLTARENFARIETEGVAEGSELRPGPGLDGALASAQRGAQGSFAAAMFGQIRSALAREGRGSTVGARYVVRSGGEGLSVMLPSAQVTGGSGSALLALTRVQWGADGRLQGNFVTGGPGLPRLQGRMEQGAGGLRLRAAMAEYRGGGGRIAMPELVVVQAPGGAIGFAGHATLSGPLPGGAADNLVLPIDGNWAPGRGLAVWRGCVPVRFRRLAYANLTLENRGLTLCPVRGQPILASTGSGLRFAAGAPSLDLVGRLGGTPIRIASGPVGFAIPGTLAATRLDVALGPANSAARFRISDLSARIGADISGRFAQTDVRLAAVPLDIFEASGTWRYANGRLTIGEGAFRLEDREALDRFKPLIARDAVLSLFNNRIEAEAVMREPTSDREVTRTRIAHSLSSGAGHADLLVEALRFDGRFQPGHITDLTAGVIAETRGTVQGTGRIDWTAERVTSGGTFSTEALNFSALFGPVRGVSGTVRFTDLLGLETAPDQRLRVAEIDTGVLVTDGEISYQLKPNNLLQVNGGTWPFMAGTLRMKPAQMTIGSAEVRRFTFEVEGLDAAVFVQRLELSNLSATGKFDGTLPLVFDENGGRVDAGALVARAPGGNVSYLGELSYAELSTMGNFAFDALKSIDYREMRIDLNGALSGEMITSVSFEGLSQGASARQNFLTRRIASQLARSRLRFRVNLRAPFFTMFTPLRSLFDETAIRDPRDIQRIGGLSNEPDVQPPDSGTTP